MIAARKLIAAALAAILVPGAVQAQDLDTSTSDLRCAVWSAMGIGASEDPEARSAFSMALVWFLARYEAATGKPYEDALTPEYVASLGPEIAAIEEECQPRMQEMGARLEGWGKTLEDAGI